VREFKGVEGRIRKHFFIYRLVRKSAPFLCRFVTLEEGFDFLASISPSSVSLSVLDIGSNDGTSIRMIRQYLPKTNIVAFDPVTRPRFDISTIEFHDLALGSEPGELKIFTPKVKGHELTQYSSFDKKKMVHQITHDLGVDESVVEVNSKLVKIVELDSLKLNSFFLKIDVEGFELEVLQGAKATIKLNLPVVLIEIQSEETFLKISEFFKDLNYVAIFVHPKKNLTDALVSKNSCRAYDPLFNNYVWIPASKSPSWAFRAK
jgi:FkbM family methyltransferase